MTQGTFFATIVSVMVFAGLLGGLVNYFATRKSDPEDSSFRKSLTLGVAASLLVPLFLNMISSNLLESIRGSASVPSDLLKIFVFAGFCLVAAISSSAFIKTLSDRILQEAREAKKVAHQADKKASETQSVIQPILDKETEGGSPDNSPVATKALTPSLNEKEVKLLQALANGKWVLRTRFGLAKDAGIPKPEVDELMDDFKKRGLVGYKWIVDRAGAKRKRWYITNEGRAAVDSH